MSTFRDVPSDAFVTECILLRYERLHGVVSTRRQNVSTLRSRGLCSLTAPWEHTPDIFLCHDHDYIQVEFKQPVRVVAIGTKGMFKSWRIDGEPHQNYYVTKYKIQYKPQEGKYMGLGNFNGNSNALIEHINDIADPHTGKIHKLSQLKRLNVSEYVSNVSHDHSNNSG